MRAGEAEKGERAEGKMPVNSGNTSTSTCMRQPDRHDWDHQSQIRRVIAFTTDLSLCSGWKPKQE